MIVSLSTTDYVCTCWLSELHTMRLYCACVCLCICLWPHAWWILNSIMCCESFTEHVYLNCVSADWEDCMASKLLLRANLQGNLQGDLAYCPCILHSRKDEQQVFHFVWMFGGSSWTDITKKRTQGHSFSCGTSSPSVYLGRHIHHMIQWTRPSLPILYTVRD